jgi:hypothetical protein
MKKRSSCNLTRTTWGIPNETGYFTRMPLWESLLEGLEGSILIDPGDRE